MTLKIHIIKIVFYFNYYSSINSAEENKTKNVKEIFFKTDFVRNKHRATIIIDGNSIVEKCKYIDVKSTNFHNKIC